MEDLKPYTSILEYSMLQPGLTMEQLEKNCKLAMNYNMAAVCLPAMFVKKATSILKGSQVKIVAGISFPFGYAAIEAKLAEVLLAVVDGADELEIVLNDTAVKNADWQYLANEVNHLLAVIHKAAKDARFVLEQAALTQDEMVKCCQLLAPTAIKMISTSTGFRGSDIPLNDLKFARKQLPAAMGLKTFRTIVTLAELKTLREIGVDRVGCNNISSFLDTINMQ